MKVGNPLSIPSLALSGANQIQHLEMGQLRLSGHLRLPVAFFFLCMLSGYLPLSRRFFFLVFFSFFLIHAVDHRFICMRVFGRARDDGTRTPFTPQNTLAHSVHRTMGRILFKSITDESTIKMSILFRLGLCESQSHCTINFS